MYFFQFKGFSVDEMAACTLLFEGTKDVGHSLLIVKTVVLCELWFPVHSVNNAGSEHKREKDIRHCF